MILKDLKNNSQLQWTSHIKNKMRQYGLSESRLKRILENPSRKEQGVAEGVVALMQNANTKRQTEIWLMYKEEDNKKILISAWRYPGISPIGVAVSEPKADGGVKDQGIANVAMCDIVKNNKIYKKHKLVMLLK